MSLVYETITNEIQVKVQPLYLEDQSDPETHSYVWAYFVIIENKGKETVQLLNRYWEITNGLGSTEVVEGTGVVGEQPILHPGISHQYNSFSRLTTPSGFMAGQFEMVTVERDEPVSFWVDIPAFSLDLRESAAPN